MFPELMIYNHSMQNTNYIYNNYKCPYVYVRRNTPKIHYLETNKKDKPFIWPFTFLLPAGLKLPRVVWVKRADFFRT